VGSTRLSSHHCSLFTPLFLKAIFQAVQLAMKLHREVGDEPHDASTAKLLMID
jgi:hypothetical protein